MPFRPLLQAPAEVATWVDDIARSWRFRQIIPCHFDAPIAAGPADLRAAFAWAFEAAGMAPPAAPFLDRLSNVLTFGWGPPAAPKVGVACPAWEGSPNDQSPAASVVSASASVCLLHEDVPAGFLMWHS